MARLRKRAAEAAAEGTAVSSPQSTGSADGEPDEAGRIVVNETNARLEITGPQGKMLVLSPLERRVITKDDFEEFEPLLHDLERRSLVALPPDDRWTAWTYIVGGAIWALIIFGAFGLFRGSTRYWIGGGVAIALAVVSLVVASRTGARTVVRWTAQFAALLIVLGIGIALPGAAIYFSAGVDELVRAAYIDGTIPKDQLDLTLLGRGLQLLFLATASLLPALLYFLFDRQQLRTLREQFQRHMFRLDPSVETLADVRAKYGTLLGEVYGDAGARNGGRLRPGRRSPVLVATIVITFGWLLTLLNPGIGLITDQAGIVQLFEPDQSTLVFGFLGAYLYALMTIQRGYARSDLRPKSYTQITVRILVAVIFAWVLQLLPGDDGAGYLLLLAFAAGLVPETALVWVREGLRGEPGREFGRGISEPDPLTKLEGIDLYDRARLLDEGVTNVEGLAHHDLIELMLETRIPAPRLVDWIDQAILYLHAGPTDDSEFSRENTLRRLHAYGIRTATDLDKAHDNARDFARDVNAFFQILPGYEDVEVPRLSVIIDAIRDEEWMENLLYWHNPRHLEERTIDWPPPPRAESASMPEEPEAGEPEPPSPADGNRGRRARRASRAPAG